MTNSGSNKGPITMEMIVDKIDAELADFTAGTAAENRDSRVEAKLEAMKHIRSALYGLPIPDELMQSVFGRENILGEIYLYWVEEFVKEASMDKVSLSYDCAEIWLGEVRHEYRTGLLCDRLAAEHEAFLAEERLKSPNEIIEDAWMIACKADLVKALRTEDLSPQDVNALLTMEHPLDAIYVSFLSKDIEGHMYDLVDAAIETAQARHQEILAKNADLNTEDSMAKQRIEEYLEEPDHEPEL